MEGKGWNADEGNGKGEKLKEAVKTPTTAVSKKWGKSSLATEKETSAESRKVPRWCGCWVQRPESEYGNLCMRLD